MKWLHHCHMILDLMVSFLNVNGTHLHFSHIQSKSEACNKAETTRMTHAPKDDVNAYGCWPKDPGLRDATLSLSLSMPIQARAWVHLPALKLTHSLGNKIIYLEDTRLPSVTPQLFMAAPQENLLLTLSTPPLTDTHAHRLATSVMVRAWNVMLMLSA